MPVRVFFAAGLLASAIAICAPAVLAESSDSPARGGTAGSAEAVADFDEGKRRYDAGDYEAARRAFALAVRHQPGNARWHYNLGLALRQLDQPYASREALLAARRLDPEYKRAEIDDKLISMGFDARDSGDTPKRAAAAPAPSGGPGDGMEYWPFWIVGGVVALVAFGGIVVSMRRDRGGKAEAFAGSAAAKVATPADPARLEAESQRLARLGALLVPAEHALRLGEDHDLRALLDRATWLERSAREQLAAARAGNGAALDGATRALDAAQPIAHQVQARVQELGVDATAHGERVGCYFCARPLANTDYRRVVPLRSRQGNAEVLACPPCADRIGRGETPEITILGGQDGPRHWSEEPGFDPYLHRHAPHAAATEVPAWRFAPSRPVASLALLAAGGALGAGAAYAATRAFDLDAARESGLAQETARAAARNAAERSGREGRGSNMRDSS